MKISSIEAYPFSVPLKSRYAYADALGPRLNSDHVLAVVRTNEGLVGYGEANISPRWSGETQEGTTATILRTLAPALIGKNPLEMGPVLDAMEDAVYLNPYAKASLEIAIVDLTGKILQTPAYRLLGGPKRGPEIPLKFAIGGFAPAKAAELAVEMKGRGFRAVKVKVGFGVAQDVARVTAVRSAVGDGFPVGVDANGGWSETEALLALPYLEELGINFIEQPIGRRNIRGNARLRQRSSIPIMLDDSMFTEEDAIEAIQLEACDIISISPGKNGGLWRSMHIAQIAAAAGIDCAIGGNVEFEVCSSAMLHLAVSIPNLSKSVGHDIIGPVYYDHQIGTPHLRIENGCAVLFEGNGLGVEVDLELIKKGGFF
jgi:L-alanine-DL-glutamate epimerase-like enolase superfamily enzyme